MSCIFYNLRNSFSIEMFRRLEKKITFQSHLINRNCFSSIYLFPTLIVFQSLSSLLYLFLSLFLVSTVCNCISFCLSPDRRFFICDIWWPLLLNVKYVLISLLYNTYLTDLQIEHINNGTSESRVNYVVNYVYMLGSFY